MALELDDLLASVVLILEGSAVSSYSHVQGFFYHLVKAHDESIHNERTPKPITMGTGTTGKELWIRITFLQERLYAQLSSTLFLLEGQTISLGTASYKVKRVLQEDHPWAGISSYRRLTQFPGTTRAGLIFSSPTFFKKGKLLHVLPEARLVFESLAKRWNSNFPKVKVPSEALEIIKVAATVSTTIRTEEITLALEKSAKFSGAIGKVTYQIAGSDPSAQVWLSVLTRFAFFAGVGAKTTYGFGMVRPIWSSLNAESSTS